MDSPDCEVQNTIKHWPSSGQLRQKLSVPLALSLTPTAQQNNTASFTDKNQDKYRCQSCKAFINKFCLIRNQNQYDCSLCGFSNHIDEKININSAELTSMSYKCKASKGLRTIMSKQRVFVFILDFSNYSQLSQKYLLYSIHALRQFINHSIQGKKNIKMMLLAFDDGIQIFNLKNQIQRIVFCDNSDSNVSDYPFSTQQIGLINQCKDNIFFILDTLQEQVNQRKFRSNNSSNKILQAVEYALKHTKSDSGKIFVVTGLNHELQRFKVMRNYDSTVQDSHKHHFPIVRKECLSQSLQNRLDSTQMSVSFFIHKSMYCNLMPFHVITKSTNGELRQYLRQQSDHFFYQFNFLIHQCLYEMKFQTLLRVRCGMGLKLVGIFGNYRQWKGIPDQVQLISCQSNRKYTFEFIIQGKINSPMTVVQFSVLYTDLKGNRHFRIITQMIELSSQMSVVLSEINYRIVNFTYLKAILHNMDLTPYYRKLQLALQERCKRHIKIVRQMQTQKAKKQAISSQNFINQEYMTKCRSYVIYTYMLMKHFLLNLHQKRDIYLDLNIQARSKLSTFQDSGGIVWPLIYVVSDVGTQIVEMKGQNFQLGTVGVVIDRGDQVYVYIKDQQMKNTIIIAKDIKKSIQAYPQLEKMSQLIAQIEDQKPFPHLDILVLDSNFMASFDIFSRKGNHSFQAFIQTILQN